MKLQITTKFWEHDPERFKQLIGKLAFVYFFLFTIAAILVINTSWIFGIIFFTLALFNITIWNSNVKYQGQKTLEKLKEESNDTRSKRTQTPSQKVQRNA